MSGPRPEFIACACMGAVYGEPYCPCEMSQRGLPSSPEHVAANEKANRELGELFGPGGKFHRAAMSAGDAKGASDE